MNLIDTVVFYISTTFLNYSISESIKEVGEVNIAGSTIRGSMDSRHLIKAIITEGIWGTRPSYLDLGTKLG
jgi:hypothetical protein